MKAAAEILESELLPDAEIELIDLNDYEMPIFSVDREAAEGVHSLARKFFDKVGAADALRRQKSRSCAARLKVWLA